MPKTRIAVLFGGTSTEHEVSLVSAKGIIDNLDKSKYEVLPILITKANEWRVHKELSTSYQPVQALKLRLASESLASSQAVLQQGRVDIVFPVLHGPFGEDGTIQGMLDLLRLPYVGSGVLGSAICMDKVLQKQLCEHASIPVAKYFSFTAHDWQMGRAGVLSELATFDYPLFVKPVSQGSSIGITKAHAINELESGINLALTRDVKVIVEQAVPHVRELECAVLGNFEPETSVVGEIIPGREFYDYQAKYLDRSSKAVIPADIPTSVSDAIRACAKLAFTVTSCAGLARVDFLLDRVTNKFYLNELNTMPGFTPISMYPKLWEASGLAYPRLLDRLVELAFERFKMHNNLNFSL